MVYSPIYLISIFKIILITYILVHYEYYEFVSSLTKIGVKENKTYQFKTYQLAVSNHKLRLR